MPVKSSVSIVIAALFASSSAAQENPVVRAYDVYAAPDRMVQLSPGRRINLRCTGGEPAAGQPTVILESGLGFPSYSWRKVQPEIARFAYVCSYDRAGLGFSDPGPLPRRAAAIADDLERLVDAAELRPPFILVGSSLGSQSVRLFAFRRPEAVRALVLIDPYVEGQYVAFGLIDPNIPEENAKAVAEEQACARLLRRHRLTAKAAEKRGCIAAPDPTFSPELMKVVRRQRLSRASVDATLSESLNLDGASEVDVRGEHRELGDMPILVLSAGSAFAGQGYSAEIERQLLDKLTELHGTIASLSGKGCVVLIPGAAHVIQSSHPGVVVQAIRHVSAGALREVCPSAEKLALPLTLGM